jgi:hypothetical protein
MIYDIPEKPESNEIPKTVVVVRHRAWVEEGDNHAGFSGYRDFNVVFTSQKEFKEWLSDKDAGDIHWIVGADNLMVINHDAAVKTAVAARNAKKKRQERERIEAQMKELNGKLKKLRKA